MEEPQLFELHRVVFFSISCSIECCILAQIHLIRNKSCFSSIFKNVVLVPLTCLVCNLFFIMGNTCTKSDVLEGILNAIITLSTSLGVLATQFSIIVYDYTLTRLRLEKKINMGECNEMERYNHDQSDYRSHRKCEIIFTTLSFASSGAIIITKLIFTVNKQCMENYGGWRTGLEIMFMILLPAIVLIYYMKGVTKREQFKKLKLANQNKVIEIQFNNGINKKTLIDGSDHVHEKQYNNNDKSEQINTV